jgi:hypothetical protein
MIADTHQTAPTQFVEANGIRFAYRRFGKAGGVPIVFNQHHLGTMDCWDPASRNGASSARAPMTTSKTIKQPALVVNGNKDLIVYTINSFILQQNIPNAQLIIYPDSNHGAPYQYPDLFVRHVSLFLSESDRAA